MVSPETFLAKPLSAVWLKDLPGVLGPGGRKWMRETGDEKGLQQPLGRWWRGRRKGGTCTKKQQKHRWKRPCGKSGCQQTKLGAGKHCLPSRAPGQGYCSVNKLAVAWTAWKLIPTPGKQRMNDSLLSRAEELVFTKGFFFFFFFAILCFILLCFLRESKWEATYMNSSG